MDKILAECLPLDLTLLSTDEDQYDKQACALVARLQKLPNQELASKDLLDALNPSLQTIPYLFALNASIDATSASGKAAPRQLPSAILPEGALWPYITQLLLDFDPVQVRYAGEYLTKVIGLVAQGAEQTRNLVPAIQLLRNAILRLDATSSTFTSTHHTYLRLCLLAQAYSEAIDILDRPIYHIPTMLDKQTEARSYKFLCSPHNTSATYLTPTTGLTLKITSRGYLEYYLMGGMCYMALGLYAKALVFYEIVLVAPVHQNVASAVMVEAYKKWLLSYLLVHGIPPNVPKGISQTTLRPIRAIAKPYDCIAEAFKGRSSARLRAEIEEGTDIWQEDSNYGLIVDVYSAYRKFEIQRLGKTYAAIPVSELAQRTSLDQQNTADTVSYLQTLISTGQLNAVLCPSKTGNDQILRFLPDTSNLKTETQVKQDLAQQTHALRQLLREIDETDHRTEISREYIEFLKRLKKIKDDEKKTGGTGRPPGVMMDDDDENMMEDF